jgi:hypothetical protein
MPMVTIKKKKNLLEFHVFTPLFIKKGYCTNSFSLIVGRTLVPMMVIRLIKSLKNVKHVVLGLKQ